MFITKKADYAVRCVLYLSKNTDRCVAINEIADNMKVSKTFLAKIVQRLSACGLVSSERGINGGFRLARNPEDVNLLEVIEAIQGVNSFSECAVDKRSCSLSCKCSVHPVWLKLRSIVEEELRGQDMKTLVEQNTK
jgi:Rrf2 family protein